MTTMKNNKTNRKNNELIADKEAMTNNEKQ